MIQAFLYDNYNNIISNLELPIENKLSYILYEPLLSYTIGYDKTLSKFRLFTNTKEEINLVNNVDNIGKLVEVLDYQVYRSEDKENIFFLYSIKTEVSNKEKIVIFSVGVNVKTNEVSLNNVFDDDYYIEPDDVIDVHFNYRESKNENDDTYKSFISAIVIKNNNFYFYDLNNSKLLSNEIENDDKPTEIVNVDIKTSQIDSGVYEKTITSSLNFIPIIFNYSKYFKLIILNSSGEIVGSFETPGEFENEIKIKRALLEVTNDGGISLSVYHLSPNGENYDLERYIFTFVSTDIVNEIHKLDTELKINLGTDNGRIAIRNSNPMYKNPVSKHKFLIKQVTNETKTIQFNDEDVSIQTFDDGEINTDEYYENEAEIRNELYGLKRDRLKEIIANKFLTNIDALASNNKISKYVSTRYKENIMAQEFNRDKLGLVVTSSVDKNNLRSHNNYSISESDVNVEDNIAIEVDGINTNKPNEEMDFFISQVANVNKLKLNEFNKIIFPFLQVSFAKFGTISIADTDLTLIYDEFKDHIKISKTEYKSNSFINDTINSLIEYIQEKYKKVGVNIEKMQIAKFVSNYFESEDKGRNIISLDENKSVYQNVSSDERIQY